MTAPVPDDADLVLHIGGPKTGSSAIQRHCRLHAAELRAAGLHYPPHPLDSNGVSGGHGETFALLTGGQPSSARRALACHLADARRAGCRLVLSAEGVYPHAADVVAALPTRSFHVVCFLRHPLDAIASHHNQGIKRHYGTATLAQTVDEIVAGNIMTDALAGRAALDWLRCCGRRRMTGLPYVERGEPVDAVARFRALLGLAGPGSTPRINRGYTPAAAAFKRLVNALPETLLAGLDEDLDRTLQAYSDASSAPRPVAADLLDAERHDALERHYRADVAAVEQAFGRVLELRRRRSSSPPDAGDTLAGVWRHVCLDGGGLADRVRAAVAAGGGCGVESLAELAGIVATGR